MVLFIGPLYSGKHDAAKAYAEVTGKQLSDLRVCEDAAAFLTDSGSSERLGQITGELAANYDIILSTEVGSGLVPVDEGERAAREAAGRLSILLAEQADEVYRVVAGIAKKLK